MKGRTLRRYFAAVLATGAALLLKESLGYQVVPSVYLTFYAAVLFSAIYGGLGPGLLSTALSAVIGWGLYLRPLEESSDVVAVRISLFLATSITATWLVHRWRQQGEALQRAKDELETRVAERTAELKEANTHLERELVERQRVATALQKSEENYRQISELMSDYAYRFRIEETGKIVFEWFGGAFWRITGFQPEEIRGVGGIFSIIHPDDRPLMVERVSRLLSGETVTSEYRIRTRKGDYRWLRDYGRPEWDDRLQRVVRIIGAASDITDRRRAEDELRLSEERFALAVAGSNDGLWDWRIDTNKIYLSPRWLEILGLAEDELGDEPSATLSRIHPEDRERAATDLRNHLEGRTPFFRCEYRTRHKDGDYRWVLSRGIARRGADGRAYRIAGSLTDVTARRRAEEEVRRREAELAHAQRLSTLGEMAAGLAHELNQPLAAIVSYARGCVRRLRGGGGRPEDLLHPIEEVAKQALRAGAVLQRYRTFIRSGTVRREWIGLNNLVREAVQFAKSAADEGRISIRLDLEADVPPVLVDGVQIEQVLINLIRNGLEAMHGCARRELWVRTRAVEEGVEVAVEDSGRGIDNEIRERIFDAFFTTKEEGLGMGLSISRSIIDAHGGRLWSTSTPGEGTTFRFFVPLRPPDADEEESAVGTQA